MLQNNLQCTGQPALPYNNVSPGSKYHSWETLSNSMQGSGKIRIISWFFLKYLNELSTNSTSTPGSYPLTWGSLSPAIMTRKTRGNILYLYCLGLVVTLVAGVLVIIYSEIWTMAMTPPWHWKDNHTGQSLSLISAQLQPLKSFIGSLSPD